MCGSPTTRLLWEGLGDVALSEDGVTVDGLGGFPVWASLSLVLWVRM